MRGEWIEMNAARRRLADGGSLPMRGEWIEILVYQVDSQREGGLSPCGESGLKCGDGSSPADGHRLSPCGESGLKYFPPLHT